MDRRAFVLGLLCAPLLRAQQGETAHDPVPFHKTLPVTVWTIPAALMPRAQVEADLLGLLLDDVHDAKEGSYSVARRREIKAKAAQLAKMPLDN